MHAACYHGFPLTAGTARSQEVALAISAGPSSELPTSASNSVPGFSMINRTPRQYMTLAGLSLSTVAAVASAKSATVLSDDNLAVAVRGTICHSAALMQPEMDQHMSASPLFFDILQPLSRTDESRVSLVSTSFSSSLQLSLPGGQKKDAQVVVSADQWKQLYTENTMLYDVPLDATIRMILKDLDVRTTRYLPMSSQWLEKYKEEGFDAIKNWAASEVLKRELGGKRRQ